MIKGTSSSKKVIRSKSAKLKIQISLNITTNPNLNFMRVKKPALWMIFSS